MGSDDLFHKRKAKAADSLKRRQSKRESYDKVLIVCEGEKTEPNYFKELVAYYKINSANVDVDGSCGSSPRSVLERAVDTYQVELARGDAYDRVYCVFDRDTHETFDETVNTIIQKRPKDTFFATTSVPCFEYWLLLHFIYTTKPYERTGTSSSGEEVLKDLLKVMSDYEKGSEGTFLLLSDQLEFAKNNAHRIQKHAKENNTNNPSTSVHELIAYLQNIKACIDAG